MKKLIKIIVLVIVLSISRINGVKAETFYEDNWVSGVYANLVDGDFSKPQQMRFIRRKLNNMASYCLTPRETIYETENYNSLSLSNINMSIEKYIRLSDIAYFGYGYPNHTSDEWYAITQFMIWREMEPNMDIFFTDKFKGNRISRFEAEMNEIENLIRRYHTVPNFSNLNLLPNKTYVFHDKNNVLEDYKIYSSEGITALKEDNNLIIKTDNIGDYYIKFGKDADLYYAPSYIHKASKGQDILVPGATTSMQMRIDIKVTKGSLKINKQDSEDNTNLENAKYGLYKNNELITILITDKNGNASYDNLVYGDYTLKEIESPKGYLKDNNIYNVTIDKELTTLNLKDNIIKANLNIKKVLNNDMDIKEEANIKFNIYDTNNKLIDTIITDENGLASIELKYGKYKIVQLNTTLGYKKVDDFYIEIKDTNDLNYTLEDKIVNSKIKILKKDSESLKLIDTAQFKIKDLINDTYLNDGEVFTTKNGIIELNIKGGKYSLEEIKSPINYNKSEDLTFIIDEELDNKELVLDVYNIRKKGKIKIIKLGKYLNNSILLLKDVQFEIYDSNNKLVDIITSNKDGIALSKELELGKYYIIEKSTLDNFKLDKTKYEIELTDNLEDDLIINKIIITNYEKKSIEDSIDNKSNLINNELTNTLEIKNKKEDNIETIYPTTSDIDRYVFIIIGYLLFIGLLYLIASIKNEK